MPASRRLILALLALLLALPALPAFQATAPAPAPAALKGEPLLERVAVIGASVSAGYGLPEIKKGAHLTLSQVIDASVPGKHQPCLDRSSLLAFADTLGSSKSALSALQKDDPTLVVALDYLFWFGYGSGWNGEKQRLAGLELGLKSLEGLQCPVLLGDFPDMRSALNARVKILPPDAVPDPATLVKLNARLAAWAKEHHNVILVPVSKLMGTLLAGEDLRVGPNLWTKNVVPELLQDDGLHTSIEGTTGLWLFAVERLFEARKDLPRSAIESKASVIDAKLLPDHKSSVVFEPLPEKRAKSAPAKADH